MTKDKKTPEEPGIFDDFKDVAKESFKQASADVNAGINGAMRAAHTAIGAVKDGYKVMENTVGRDRLWGAGAGMKVGGLFFASKPHPAVPAYIASIGVGVIVGGVGGFILGPKIAEKYRKANGIDESNDNGTPPADTPKPPGP